MITIHDVAKSMDRRKGSGGFPFTITYLTADTRRGGAGEVKVLKGQLPKPTARYRLSRDRAAGHSPTVDVQPVGLSTRVRVHLDLILLYNAQPVA